MKLPGQSFYNAHFPGLYSIVLEENGDCLKRIYIAKPGELHKNLQSEDGTFLWHQHAYDLRETSICGAVENICIRIGCNDVFHTYEIFAGITSGSKPKLNRLPTKVLMSEFRRDYCKEGESFLLNKDIIHRVVFKPNEKGWFACLVEEFNKDIPPKYVYSEKLLNEIPDADSLYTKIDNEEAKKVLFELESENNISL
jgi:hypothetical protein